MNRKRWILIILFIIIVIVSAGLFYYYNVLLQSGEIEVLDQAGRTIHVPRNVDKIISLWPEATRVIIALGCGDKLVGVDSNEKRDPVMTQIYPQLKQLPDVGSLRTGVNIEQVISLKPSVIFADAMMPETADSIQEQTRIPVVCVRISLPPDGHFSFELITIIGKILQKSDRADYIRSFLENKLSKVTDVTSEIPKNERITGYVAFARDPLTTLGHVDPLVSAGVINVAAKGFKSIWYAVNIEQLITWNPEIIIVHCLHERIGNYTIEMLRNDPQWQQIRAVQMGKVYNVIIGYYGCYPAFSVINVMQIAKIAYPERFKSLDIEAEGNNIYKALYDIDDFFSGIAQEFNLFIPK